MKPRVFWAPIEDRPWCVTWYGTFASFPCWRDAYDHARRITR